MKRNFLVNALLSPLGRFFAVALVAFHAARAAADPGTPSRWLKLAILLVTATAIFYLHSHSRKHRW